MKLIQDLFELQTPDNIPLVANEGDLQHAQMKRKLCTIVTEFSVFLFTDYSLLPQLKTVYLNICNFIKYILDLNLKYLLINKPDELQ